MIILIEQMEWTNGINKQRTIGVEYVTADEIEQAGDAEENRVVHGLSARRLEFLCCI